MSQASSKSVVASVYAEATKSPSATSKISKAEEDEVFDDAPPKHDEGDKGEAKGNILLIGL